MSGRTRVTLPDGRRVIGFRKTLAQRHRTPMHLLPDWQVSFVLPGTLGLRGDVSVIGTRVDPRTGLVIVTGKNKQWVFGQVSAFLKAVAPYGLPSPLNIRVQRGAEPGPTVSGPNRPGEDKTMSIDFNGREVRLISGASMRLIA